LPHPKGTNFRTGQSTIYPCTRVDNLRNRDVEGAIGWYVERGREVGAEHEARIIAGIGLRDSSSPLRIPGKSDRGHAKVLLQEKTVKLAHCAQPARRIDAKRIGQAAHVCLGVYRVNTFERFDQRAGGAGESPIVPGVALR